MSSDDIPVALEILDDDGNVIATGEMPTKENKARPRPRGPRSPSAPKMAGIIVAGAITVGLISVVAADDAEPPPEESSPLLIGGDVDLEGFLAWSEYPLFGREWDIELVVQHSDSNAIRTIDLNTGGTRELGSVDAGRGFVQSATWIDGDLFVNTGTHIQRLRDGQAETVHRVDPLDAGLLTVGNYWQTQSLFSSGLNLTHLDSGVGVTVDGISDFTAVGDDIFATLGGLIVRIDGDGKSEEWAIGELLTSGPTGVTWRQCRAIGDCEYWAGTASDSKALQLDPSVAESSLVLGVRTATGGSGVFGALRLLSPSLRYGVTVDANDPESSITIAIADLLTGATTTLEGATTPPAFSPDGRLMLIGGQFGDIVAVDLETSEAARLELGTNSSPFFEIVVIPSS